MRILISSVGTRGDVQPAIALGRELKALGHDVRMCVPPNFTAWAEEQGFEARAMGVEMRPPRPGAPPPVVPDLIADQFDTVGAAAQGCDLLVGAGGHQYALRSVAERLDVPSVVAVYAPTSLPSADHAPPGPAAGGDTQANEQLWREERGRWNDRALARVNANRERLGLAPVADLLDHILGERPWLAADRVLAPAPAGLDVAQTGAWVLADESPLPPDVEAFLQAGEPPVYLGLGSMPADEGASGPLIAAVRAVGRRAILSRGWAGLGPVDDAPDCLAVEDLNHHALFRRVVAVIHHGGAGTTTAAALAGAPQVVTPMFADQFYWGRRVGALGLGGAVPAAGLDAAALAGALRSALDPAVAARARGLTARLTRDGTASAARRLVAAA